MLCDPSGVSRCARAWCVLVTLWGCTSPSSGDPDTTQGGDAGALDEADAAQGAADTGDVTEPPSQDAAAPSEECQADADCVRGQICSESRCVEGCRVPADCEQGYACQAQRCVFTGCLTDEDCGRGFQCRGGECFEVGAAPCEGDDDCGLRWSCSEAGVCIEGPCATHADCSEGLWCLEGVCLERRLEVGPVRFERLSQEPFTSHVSALAEDSCCGCVFCEKVEGFGGALLDFDGDRDLDLFLGSRQPGERSAPCLYRNDSEPGQITLTPVEGACGPEMSPAMTGFGVDLEQDGRHELLLMGPGALRLARFSPGEVQITDLLALLPPGDARRRCVAGAALTTDFDLDGRADLLVGCQLDLISPCCGAQDYEAQGNLAFRQSEGGELELWTGPHPELLNDEGITLALAGLDFNQDGLGDLLLANDTFTRRDSLSNAQAPGGALLACAPDEGCRWRPLPFGEGGQAWGSYMGFGNVAVDGRGDYVYVTDWGPNRLLRPGEDVCVDTAPELGVELARDDWDFLFAWGVVVDDFDRNGLDDLYVTHGMTWPGYVQPGQEQHDRVLLQRADGDFVTLLADEVGLALHTIEDGAHPDNPGGDSPFSARGAVRADLDADGDMEILTAGLMGVVRAHSEVPQDPSEPPRCTLIPRGHTVPTFGHGYATSPSNEDRWRRRDIQGQMRFGASPWLLSEHNQGRLRFPSGAVVDYDCAGGAGPVEVVEPQWVQVEVEGEGVQITLQTPWLSRPPQVEVALRPYSEGVVVVSAESVGVQRWRVPHGGAEDLMLKVDGQWVARRFLLSAQ